MDINQVYPGFSVTNRCIMYASILLAPAQYISGIGNNCPSNLGFLAYNYYTQVYWYRAIKSRQLHALSLLPAHFNTIQAISYIGGVSSGNAFSAVAATLGTAGVIILNTIAAWTSWATNMTDGYGRYEFFFFGWRTLTPGWHKFFLVWQIGNSLESLSMIFFCYYAANMAFRLAEKLGEKHDYRLFGLTFGPDVLKYPAIIVGPIVAIIFFWPLIMWVELIVARNHIESATDMVAVWLFIAQVGTMLMPSCGLRGRRR